MMVEPVEDAGSVGGRPVVERRHGAGQRRAADAKDAAQIAHAIGGVPGFALPNVVTPGLAAPIDFPGPALTYCIGTHVREAEVDSETGVVRALVNDIVSMTAGASSIR